MEISSIHTCNILVLLHSRDIAPVVTAGAGADTHTQVSQCVPVSHLTALKRKMRALQPTARTKEWLVISDHRVSRSLRIVNSRILYCYFIVAIDPRISTTKARERATYTKEAIDHRVGRCAKRGRNCSTRQDAGDSLKRRRRDAKSIERQRRENEYILMKSQTSGLECHLGKHVECFTIRLEQ